MARPIGSKNTEKEVYVPSTPIGELAKRPAGELSKKQLNAVKDYSEAKKVVSEAQGKIDHYAKLAADVQIDLQAAKDKLAKIAETLF